MLSDATSAQDAKREIAADTADDFEWVNAWAASASPQTSRPAREAVPQGTALVQELAHIQPKERRASEPAIAEGARLTATETPASTPDPVADIDAAPVTSVEIGAEQNIVTVAGPLSSADVLASDEASSETVTSIPLAPETEAVAGATTAMDPSSPAVESEWVELVDEQSPQAEAQPASVPISFLDFARRTKPWRSLFGIAARHGEPQAETDAVDPLEALPSSSDPVAPDAVTLLDLAPAIAPDQLESDIAEIEVRRDGLLAEWEQEWRMMAEPATRPRTTDYVPILLGCVLGFTLVVVFGAAASFVSLR